MQSHTRDRLQMGTLPKCITEKTLLRDTACEQQMFKALEMHLNQLILTTDSDHTTG